MQTPVRYLPVCFGVVQCTSAAWAAEGPGLKAAVLAGWFEWRIAYCKLRCNPNGCCIQSKCRSTLNAAAALCVKQYGLQNDACMHPWPLLTGHKRHCNPHSMQSYQG
jgi:hypothetical protein